MSEVALLLEDEPLIAMDVEASLKAEGFAVACLDSCAAAADWLRSNPPPSVAILDVELRDGPCHEVAQRLIDLEVPFVVHSAIPTSLTQDGPFAAGVWLPKPSSTGELMETVQEISREP